MVPTGTGNQGKPGKMGRHFPVREFYSIYWKNQKKLYWKIEKNTGKVREICQPVIVKTLQIWYHTLNKKWTLKNTGKLQKILEKSGKFVSRKKWELYLTNRQSYGNSYVVQSLCINPKKPWFKNFKKIKAAILGVIIFVILTLFPQVSTMR